MDGAIMYELTLFLIGYIVLQYIMPLLESACGLVSYYIGELICKKEIQIEKMKIEFEKEHSKGETNVIGYNRDHYDEESDCDSDCDCDDCDCIGINESKEVEMKRVIGYAKD
jgi:hypothetical protein